MRDIIWTLIGIWLIYKLIDVFKGLNQKKTQAAPVSDNQKRPTVHPTEKDMHSALQKHLNKEGEYVDFEEIK